MNENYTEALLLTERLERKGVRLWREGDRIKFKANAGALLPEDLAELKRLKPDLLALLDPERGRVRLTVSEAERSQPFVLTDVQQSYLMGRSDLFRYGGIACHIYLQLNYPHLDAAKAERVWNHLIARHEMLRAVIHEEGWQEIMETAPHFTVTDYQDLEPERIQKLMGHQQFRIGSWPYFAVGVSENSAGAMMHFSIEFIIADWTSIWMLLYQFEQLYFGEAEDIEPAGVSFRDYVISEREWKESAAGARDRHYWLSRLDDFPVCPQIPAEPYVPGQAARFERRSLQLSVSRWETVRQFAAKYGVTPTALVLTVYAHVLSCFSENKRFAINLTMLSRKPVHPEIGKVVGDFTTLTLLDMDLDNRDPFIENVRRANLRLFEDMDHSFYSGVSFMREIANKKGADAAFMPYVFTSAAGLLSAMEHETVRGMVTGIGISQTPQVFIDCQLMDGSFGMQVNWDVRQGVFRDGMLDDMFSLFSEILQAMADGTEPDLAAEQSVPHAQEAIFRQANSTAMQLPQHLLHEQVFAAAASHPEKTAVICGEQKYSYRTLTELTGGLIRVLTAHGVRAGEPVGIAAKKSVWQPAAALAVLALSGVYVPVSPEQGVRRIARIIERAGIRTVLTLSDDETQYPESVTVIRADAAAPAAMPLLKTAAKPGDLAYIIFTSGSTGEPKGVAISHAAAVNTIEDINRKYRVGAADSVLGVSQLSFDLSVYDIFGLLSVGGMLVYPEDSRKKDPRYLAELIAANRVTVWNSVPSLLSMVTVCLDHEQDAPPLDSLRLVLLSGDWIPLALPDHLHAYAPGAQVVSLGGATEAAIWSIYHDYTGPAEGFASIPYGLPLANQQFRVLDSTLRDRPVGVRGDLYILGDGLADGYYHDPEKTAAQFLTDPVSGRRMYRTGDTGKYHRSGEIEFLGRSDFQIKFNGHRIEPGEIERAVTGSGLAAQCAVIYSADADERALICCYAPAFADDRQQAEHRAAFDRLTAACSADGGAETALLRSAADFAVRFADENGGSLRILEAGAGDCTGADFIAAALGSRVCTYDAADCDGCAAAASRSAQTADGAKLRYLRLVPDTDIAEQGFSENSYDLVIVSGLPDGSALSEEAAAQFRRLVRPCGALLMRLPEGAKAPDHAEKLAAASGEVLYAALVKPERCFVTGGEIAERIRADLPAYMIPSVFVMLDRLPVTANGKTDRKALKAIAKQKTASGAVQQASAAAAPADMTPLQRSVAEIFEGLGLKGIGLRDSFYDRGADSLMMAQATGGIRDRILRDVPFDTLLRFMLNHPTVEAVAEFIASAQTEDSEPADKAEKPSAHIGAAQIYPSGEGPLRVVFHAAFGTMNSLRYVVGALVQQQQGDVMTISLGDAERYYAMDRETAVQQISDDYTAMILETGAKRVQLIGYCFGGWLATQCANRLLEQGVEIADLILIDSQTVPWQIEDDLMIEMMFLPNFGLTLRDLDAFADCEIPDMEKMFFGLLEQYGKIPANMYEILEQNPDYAAFGRGMRRLSEIDIRERFRIYAERGSEKTGEQLAPAMLEGVFRSYCQTLRCCDGEMEPYFGDVRYLNGRDNTGVFYSKEKNLSYWTEICVGEIQITDIAGDHYSCVENPEYAAEVSRIIADYGHTASH